VLTWVLLLACASPAPEEAPAAIELPPGAAAPTPPSERSAPRAGKVRPGAPAIIFAVVDTWRADRLSIYGHWRETTPNLAWLSEQAIVFDRAWAAAPWTLPSVTSLLTGRYPSAHTVTETDRALPTEVETLPGRLRAAGYEAAFFGVNSYFAPSYGLERAFDTYRWFDGLDGRQLNRELDAFLTARAAGPEAPEAPLFLYVHYFDPHCPYRGPDDLRGSYSPTPEGRRSGRSLTPEAYQALPDCYRLQRADGSPELDVDVYLAEYDVEVTHTDRVLADLFDVLDKHGLYDRSLLVVAGDHGEAFWEHGDYGHGRELYEPALHVPLLIRPPGGYRRLTREAAPVSLVDLAPTALAAAGLEIGPGMVGRDLTPIWGPGELAPAPLFAESSYENTELAAALDGLKLVQGAPGGLFDLAADPVEQADLRASQPERAAALEEALEGWRARNQEAAAGLTVSELKPGDDLIQQLKSVGYMH
jgi:arylsulfatase A-like enzyme